MREDNKRGEAVEAPGAREKAARSSARLLRTPAKLQDADDAPPTTHPSVKERAPLRYRYFRSTFLACAR